MERRNGWLKSVLPMLISKLLATIDEESGS